MKYDLHLNPEDHNTSHVQVLDLVGTDKRVLDVGCSTGYLAAALKERGNRVTGVERDPDAGALARPHLDQLVIGDLEAMDLAAEVGEHGFDVIVFADVLEHLTDPLSVLSQAPRLLAPGGSVVVSIPNIAHGAVRLALLQGRFEYRDLGLLDDTHVRFFTRSSVEELHRLAGLTPVEHRRTEADPFGTEIPLREGDFPADVVDHLRRDHEATTYQFVIRSVAADETTDNVAAELTARTAEVLELRSQLSRVSEVTTRTRPAVLACVLPPNPQASDELRGLVIADELQRRLPGWSVGVYEWGGSPHPACDGRPVRSFTPDGPADERTATTVDAAALVGTWSAADAGEALERIAEDGCRAHVAGIGGTTLADLPTLPSPAAVAGWSADLRDVVVDPLIIVDRTQDPNLLILRSQYLAATGRLPSPGGYVLAQMSSGQPAATGRAIDLLTGTDADGAEGRPAATGVHDIAILADVDRDPGGVTAKALATECSRATLVTDGLTQLELLAAVAQASLVVSDDDAVVAAALAFKRPAVALAGGAAAGALAALGHWLDEPDLVIDAPGGLAAAASLAQRRSTTAAPMQRAVDALDLFLDELADAVAGQVSPRLVASLPAQLAEAQHRSAELEAVNRGLRHQLRRQQVGFGALAHQALSAAGDGTVTGIVHHAALQDLRAAEAEVARMQEEVRELSLQIQATDNTLTMRTLRPARRVYGRLRSR